MNPALVYVVAGFFVGVVTGTFKPFAGFHKGPPTQELTQAQANLTAAQQNAKEALAAKDAANAEERAKLESQIRSAQGDATGVVEAIKRVPPSNQTAEVKLAGALAQRVDFKLGAAIGKLPETDRQAMLELIDQALSGKQAEIDEANRKIVARDEAFKVLTAERDQIKAQIPILTKEAQEANQKADAAQSEVTVKTNEVKTWADKAQVALGENGSLWAGIKKAVWIIGGGYVFLVLILPGIVKHLDSGNPMKTVLRHVAGLTTSPLLYLDAMKKIPRTP